MTLDNTVCMFPEHTGHSINQLTCSSPPRPSRLPGLVLSGSTMEELEAELREIRSRRLSSKSKSLPKSKCRSVVLQRLSLYVRSKQETARLGESEWTEQSQSSLATPRKGC